MRDTRTLKGFLLSFLLHLLIFLLFFISFEDMKFTPPPPSSKQEKKISLNLSQFTPPAPQPKPRPKVIPPQQKTVPTPPLTPPKPVEKPVEKKPEVKPQPPVPVAKKKIVEKKKGFEVAQKSKEENNVTKVAKKEPKKAEKKRLVKKEPKKKKVAKKKPLPKRFHLPKRGSKDKLANSLLNTPNRNKSRSSNSGRPSRIIQQLYGKEFYSFTPTQQKFIKNHLSEIYRITQNTLYINGYPDIAVRTHQQGVNVVSFYLHPNGSISQLRLIKPMGYEALDDNTIAVIQIAYKDYPRPKTKTKIVFYVNYRLY